MADYERYGEYNIGDDEERGPERGRVWNIIRVVLRATIIFVLLGVCLSLAFRMISSGYYPKSVKRLYYTEALAAYAAVNPTAFETQDLRVPFDDVLIISGDDGRVVQSETRTGFYYADNLIVERTNGTLQCSIRINKNNLDEIAAFCGMEEFAFSADAFEFLLWDNSNINALNQPVVGSGKTYQPTYVSVDSALMYHYIKICFDGVDFTDAKWMRLDITPRGADTTKEAYKQLGICVYENNDDFNYFTAYRLKNAEKLK